MDNNNFSFGKIILSFIGVGLCIWFFSILFFSIKIPAGYSGILIDLYGSDKGVQVSGLHTGRNFYNSITHDAEKYPIFINQIEYEGMEFQDVDGLRMSANVGISYKFIEDKIGVVYETYRASADKVTDTYMRTWLRDAINRVSSGYTVDVLYGEKKEEFRQKVTESLQKDLETKGIYIDKVYFVGAFSLPEVVQARINSKIEATQKAIQAENELRAVEAEAKKNVAEAEGEKKSKILKSQGEAESIRIQSEAIRAQGGAEYVRLKWIEKWNGALPTTSLGESTPIITIK